MGKTLSDHGINIPAGAANETRTTCPQCSDQRRKKRDRCLAVNVSKGTWLCHHCGWSGGVDKPETPAEYVAKTPTPRQYQKPKPPKADPDGLPEKVIKWFKDRGISEATLTAAGIGYGPVWMPQENREVSAINFPYRVGGELVNVKYRDGKKNFRMEKGAERVLYGLDDVNEFQTIWVEGEIDKLSFAEAGFDNCVSVPDGAPTPSTQNYSSKFDFLDSAEDIIQPVMSHIIAVDSDAPGVRLKTELIRRLGPGKCRVVEWPDGCKDANDVLIKHGGEGLRSAIAGAKPAPVAGVFDVDDIEREILDFYNYGFERGEKTGWHSVDKLYTVRVREWSVVTGIPGHGKSEWLDALMVNLAKHSGWRFGVCSMENYPLSRHLAKLVEKYVGLPFQANGQVTRMGMDQLQESIKWAKDHFFFLHPEDDDLTIDGLLKLAQVLVYRHGINGLVIDPWNELDHQWPREQNEVMYISSALSKIRRFARKAGCHIWVVAHPTKLQKKTDGQYPVPTPYDISGASHWRNKSDNAITIHRPNMKDFRDPSVEVHIQKVRFKEVGRVGFTTLKYDYANGRYSE